MKRFLQPYLNAISILTSNQIHYYYAITQLADRILLQWYSLNVVTFGLIASHYQKYSYYCNCI